MDEILKKEIEEFAYTLPHSATSNEGPRKHYEDPRIMEARENGWSHSWGFEEIMAIANKAFELATEKAKTWIQDEIIEDYSTIIWEDAIDDFTNYMKN